MLAERVGTFVVRGRRRRWRQFTASAQTDGKCNEEVLDSALDLACVEFGEELLHAQHGDAVLLEMRNQIKVAFDVVVARDCVLRLSEHGRLEDEVVVGVAALMYRPGGHDDLAALHQQLQELLDIGGLDGVLVRDAWARQNIGKLVEQRQ